ncbi:MAG: zinc-binding dehydrogenase [Spirochaetes bacterium]|nr:zinc-binding dehydrogenase [Spirochaetota bacterium]
MKAARIVSPRKFEIFDEKISDLPEGMVMVKLTHAALCGSDYPYFYNEFPSPSYPLPAGYPGHECCGVVLKSKSPFFDEGDRVMYYPPHLDGYKECHIAEPLRLQKLPDCEVPIKTLLLTQVVGCVSHAVFRIDRPYKKSVVIVGQGPIGLIFTALMKRHGASQVIALDLLDYRLEIAKKMGADFVINPAREDAHEKVKALTEGLMADIVIDAYGQKSEVINMCFELARHNGQVAFFGICLEEKPRLDFNTFFRKELRMIASVGPELKIDYPYALQMIVSGAIDVSPLVSHTMPFEKIQEAFELAISRKENVVKVVLEF